MGIRFLGLPMADGPPQCFHGGNDDNAYNFIGGLEHFLLYFSIQLGIQLTFIFFRGVGIPPTRFNFGASNFGQSHPFRYEKDQKSSINGGGETTIRKMMVA
jgi:hypothetical protein